MRGISMSSSTRSRYVVVFFTFRQSRTTCWRSVNRFREYRVENRATARRASTIARSTNWRSCDFGRASIIPRATHSLCFSARVSTRPELSRFSGCQHDCCLSLSHGVLRWTPFEPPHPFWEIQTVSSDEITRQSATERPIWRRDKSRADLEVDTSEMLTAVVWLALLEIRIGRGRVRLLYQAKKRLNRWCVGRSEVIC